jgi:2-dehydropantoate 2-reductase
MKVLILGAGAVGGYFGGRLAQSDFDVTFLVRTERLRQLKAKGLKIISEYGSYEGKNLRFCEKADSTYDLIVLSCKAWDLKSAMSVIQPAVSATTTILPLLNGMSHLQALQTEFGKHSVIGGLCIISSTVNADGQIVHLNDRHTIKYGELNGAITPRIEQIDELFKSAICDAILSAQIEADMWEKWVMISSLAAYTTSMRAAVGEIARSPHGQQIAARIFNECWSIANAHGFTPDKSYVERLQDTQSKLTASMLRDMQNGNKIESDQILGALIARAMEKGISVPNLETAYCNLKVYELGRPAT